MNTYYYKGTEVTPSELKDFIDYVYSFYNVVDGLYPVYGCTKNKIRFATYEYLGQCAADNHYEWGNGDSLDRERVRDIMFELFPSISYAKTNS